MKSHPISKLNTPTTSPCGACGYPKASTIISTAPPGNTKQKIKKSLKKIEAKEKKVTVNIEKKAAKNKPLTTKKK